MILRLALSIGLAMGLSVNIARADGLTSEVLLETKTYGGYVRVDHAGYNSGIRIFRDGNVHAFSQKSLRDPVVIQQIAHLSPDALESLRTQLEHLGSGQLLFPGNDVPRCVDAPDTDYKAGNVLFAKVSQCVTGFLESSPYLARNLKRLLDSFAMLRPIH